MAATAKTNCLWRPQPARDSGPAILFLPHSGASAQQFAPWRDAFGPEVEFVAAQYPGRASRASEPVPLSVAQLAEEIASALGSFEDRAMHVFGHSLGAFVGFELCWRLADSRHGPRSLIVSGAPPLHLKQPDEASPRTMSDAELWREISRYGSDLKDLMKYPVLAEQFLSVCRADMAMAAEYRFGADRRRLEIPIMVLGGADDSVVPASTLSRWEELTVGTCHCHAMPGGHFYFDDDIDAVAALVARHMEQVDG